RQLGAGGLNVCGMPADDLANRALHRGVTEAAVAVDEVESEADGLAVEHVENRTAEIDHPIEVAAGELVGDALHEDGARTIRAAAAFVGSAVWWVSGAGNCAVVALLVGWEVSAFIASPRWWVKKSGLRSRLDA